MKELSIERVYVFPDGTEKAESDMSVEEIIAAEDNIRKKIKERFNIKSDI